MKEKIKKILTNYYSTNLPLNDAVQQVLDLFDVRQSLPDDDEVEDLVNEIAYKQHHGEQGDDFLEKMWIVKQKLKKWFGKEYKL